MLYRSVCWLGLSLLIACSPNEGHGASTEPDGPEIQQPATPEGKSPEAVKLLDFFGEIAGAKMLSGSMANVNWNINEATWIYKHTGKWPALNGFDFLHFFASTAGGWIDYENISVVEKWWNDGGIVAAMWHWNMLANDGQNYAYTPGTQMDGSHTNFDLRKIDDPDSKEYKQLLKDMDKVATYLKLLKAKNIPVLWRPLHEAAGNYYVEADWGTAWFWWGYYGPEPFKKLWRLMHDRFVNLHGLNNLIWVWTYEPEGYNEWYPGEDYVDMVGSDIYTQSSSTFMAGRYEDMRKHFNDKPAVLSECGSVALISEQWKSGARWIYFMPWYDYNRTNSMTSAAFNDTGHEHAPVGWWRDAFNCDFVLSRDELPSLK
jgi:mannan endo-1,4-beta-mannosidase